MLHRLVYSERVATEEGMRKRKRLDPALFESGVTLARIASSGYPNKRQALSPETLPQEGTELCFNCHKHGHSAWQCHDAELAGAELRISRNRDSISAKADSRSGTQNHGAQRHGGRGRRGAYHPSRVSSSSGSTLRGKRGRGGRVPQRQQHRSKRPRHS